MHKFSFVVTYPGFQQRKEQSVLETPEERLGTEALGRAEGVLTGTLMLRDPEWQQALCSGKLLPSKWQQPEVKQQPLSQERF